MTPIGSILGPNISGDSLDIKDNLILSGSYWDNDALELYDLRKLKKLCNVGETSGNWRKIEYVSSC